MILQLFTTFGLPTGVFLGVPRTAAPEAGWPVPVALAAARAAMALPAMTLAMSSGAVVLSPASGAVGGPVFVGAEWLARRHLTA
jgi:hypothetical protein